VKTLITSLVLLITLLNAEVSYAESTGYEVEIIIFSYPNNPYAASETWPENTAPEKPIMPDVQSNILLDHKIVENNLLAETTDLNHDESILKIDQEQPPVPIDLNKEAEFLSAENYRLTKQAKRIKNNKNYTLLIHKAWKQAGLASDQAFSVHLNSLETEVKKVDKTGELAVTPMLYTSIQETMKSTVPHTEYLEGDVKLIMSRYLHISANLILHKYTKSLNEEDLITNNKEHLFKINIERRMKSKEIHFIDHPLLGILVIATPFKIPDPVQDEQNINTLYKTLN